MRVLMPAAGDSELFKAAGHHYPQNLVEIDGSPLIERVIAGLRPLLTDPGDLTCVLRKTEDARFHTADVVRLLVPDARVVTVPDKTGGAACSALLAVEEIDVELPLLVFNGDQVIDADLVAITAGFVDDGLDAGIIVFEAVHPRWSYVRCDDAGLVIEAAEKRPISTLATAGAYWYRRGGDFLHALTEMIKKDAHLDGRYYICPSFNELVLRQARIGVHHIDRDQYLSLHTPQGAQAYEEQLIARRKAVV